MSANRGIVADKSALEVLKELNDFIGIFKNPDDIKKAHDILRKEISLTDDEILKVETARKIIEESSIISQKIQDEKAALELARAAHIKNVSGLEEKTEEAAKIYQLRIAEAEKENIRVVNLEKQLIDDRKQFEIERKKHAQEHVLRMQEAQKLADEAEKSKKRHDDLANEILAAKIKMKQKAKEAALRAQEAAEF